MPRGRPFTKGNPGRPPGIPNKVTREIRAAIEEAFEKRGGAAYLAKLPDDLFVRLIVRLLPIQVEGSGDDRRPIAMRWLGDDDEPAPGAA